jgi:4-hydroxybenzoate polyprenyltransferase
MEMRLARLRVRSSSTEEEIAVSVLPYRKDLLELIERERQRARRVVLVTGYNSSLATGIANHLGLTALVVPSSSRCDALRQRFGEGGFDYVGSSRDDLAVWRVARMAYVVDAPPSVERSARELANLAAVLGSARPTLGDWVRAFRLHQWLKNVLLFVPLLAAHRYTEWPLVLDALVAFLCFGLCASSVYILNDLLDLRDDRQHPTKRFRPFASGRLSIRAGLVAFPLLLAAAFGIALWLVPIGLAQGLACYYALTVAYSMWLKRRLVIDVIILAALYTLRIIVGAVALDIPLSFWLLAFSMFMFSSLALVKRYAELRQLRAQGASEQAHGRGYLVDDLQMIASLGAACGYVAVMVLALYINDPKTTQLYRHQELIWFACPMLLAWISRVWMVAHRGAMNDDPVVFAMRDRVSLLLGALMALVIYAAT